MLVVSVWQAPVPWVHLHSLQAGASDAPALVEHLRTFHSASRVQLSEPLGWHLHFALFGDLCGCQHENHDPATPNPFRAPPEFHPLVQSAAPPAIDAESSVLAFVLPLLKSNLQEQDPNRDPRENYLATWTDSSPLLVLICVARC